MSLQDVGELVGVSRNAVYLWETSEETEITVVNCIKLSEALQMPLVDLLPPEASGEETTIRDPQELLLVQRFRKLDEQQKEVYLRLLLVMREAPSQES